MKRLGLIIAAVAMSLSVGFAQGVNKGNEPFKVDFKRLSSYLELTPDQMPEVSDITDYFLKTQAESLSARPARQEKKMHDAVYGNLKLMKSALNDTQYRKYLTLINITNNNNAVFNMKTLPDDGYFANND